ncbi:MAG TPA: tetratricopeptide repeat protein, partial [Dehalococcoidia bacterium]|nr:tetratricopeptide repeat protein [Dehalococcoidia bacterium]
MVDEALQLANSYAPVQWTLAVCSAYMGREKEAVELLEQSMTIYPVAGSEQDEINTFPSVCILEASVLLKHKEIAETLFERLKSTTVSTTGMWWLTCIPRHLGGAAALLERYDEAKEHFEEAITVCTDMRFRPELALSRLGLGEVLLDHYPDEKPEALEHLDFAIKEFREMKMQPSLERALRRKDILKA